MPNQIMRQNLDSLLPPGSAFTPKTDGGMDQFFEGISDNWERSRARLALLADIRNPWKTEMLTDLEREFGITPNPNYTEEMRRQVLAQKMYTRDQRGTVDEMQMALRAAGFDVYVYENDPAIDPAPFLVQDFLMTCGADNAYCGEPSAVCGNIGGELLVNGPLFSQIPAIGMCCGSEVAYCEEPEAVCGFYDSLQLIPYVYPIPTDPADWPFVFWVGGVATFGPGGEITDIAQVNIPIYREFEFKEIILRLKPMHSWAALIVSFS
jgi:hypothetical protein